MNYLCARVSSLLSWCWSWSCIVSVLFLPQLLLGLAGWLAWLVGDARRQRALASSSSLGRYRRALIVFLSVSLFLAVSVILAASSLQALAGNPLHLVVLVIRASERGILLMQVVEPRVRHRSARRDATTRLVNQHALHIHKEHHESAFHTITVAQVKGKDSPIRGRHRRGPAAARSWRAAARATLGSSSCSPAGSRRPASSLRPAYPALCINTLTTIIESIRQSQWHSQYEYCNTYLKMRNSSSISESPGKSGCLLTISTKMQPMDQESTGVE